MRHAGGVCTGRWKTGRKVAGALCTSLLMMAPGSAGAAEETPPVQTVAAVELERYLGKWYEIARFPMFFQRNCVGDVTADYSLREDGRIRVLNRCRTDKGFDEAEGTARVVEDSGGAKLRVSFFWPFSGDYWIIGLAPDYRWAVVGDPERKYLWILSRTPVMPLDVLEKARQAARDQGYDLGGLRYTEQRLD